MLDRPVSGRIFFEQVIRTGSSFLSLGGYGPGEPMSVDAALAAVHGDRRGVAHVLDNIGDAYVELGEHDKAAECYREALEIARAFRDQRGEAIYLGNLARAERGGGQAEQAGRTTEKARRTAERAWAELAALPDTQATKIRARLRESFPGARALGSTRGRVPH